MKPFLFALSAIVLSLVPASAHADTIFNLTNGTLSDGGTFTGTFSLSPANLVTSGYFTFFDKGRTDIDDVALNPVLNTPQSITSISFFQDPTTSSPPFNSSEFLLVLKIGIPGSTPLFCPALSRVCAADSIFLNETGLSPLVTGGTITPALAPTPEPSSLILLGTGVAAIAATARRRLRNVTRTA